MDPNSIQVQEKIFEIVSSEATYVHSLDLLVKYFMESPKLSGYVGQGSVISFVDRKNLFSTILEVRKGSRRLLNALFLSVKNCIMLDEIFEILAEHLAQQESTYVNYCSSLSYQQRTLRNLRETKQEFCKAIKTIEKAEELQNQSLSSFLMQPMQRVTRYPLMVDAVLRDLDEKDRRIDSVRKAQEVANRMVSKCDQTIKCFERMEELLELENSLTYKSSSPRRFPLVSEKRSFLMKDSFHMLYTLNRPSGRFGWTNCVLFLFSDMLMITKATDHGQFVVKGYCERKFITISSAQSCFIPLSKSHNGFFCSLKYVFFCVLEKDHSGKRSEVAFATEEKQQMDRWMDALEKTNDSNGQMHPVAYIKNNYCTVPRRYKKVP
ncbi:RhoGEF domain protein [Trichuris suis]|nr:RhoGEF domain protein [Trichuris suis]